MAIGFGGKSREDLESEYWEDKPLFGRGILSDDFEDYKLEIDKAVEEGEDLDDLSSDELMRRVNDK